MKAHMINTKFWTDEKVCNFSLEGKLLFLYLLTSPYTSLTGAFEITRRVIAFDTGLGEPQLSAALAELEGAGRILLWQNWIVVPRMSRYTSYLASNLTREAYKKELKTLPKELVEKIKSSLPSEIYEVYDMDRVMIAYPYAIHTHSNSNSNSNSKERGSGGKPKPPINYHVEPGRDEWEQGYREPSKPPYKLWSEAKDYADLRGEDREYMDNACYMGDKRLAPAGPPKGTPEKLVAEWRKVYARKYGTEVQPSNPAHAGN